MTLILAETTTEMRNQLDENNITRLWQLSYQALDHINNDHPMAGQCTAALQKIKKRAWQMHQGRSTYVLTFAFFIWLPVREALHNFYLQR